MNTNAERWVEALRSGEYQQAKSVLYDGTGYCCLGVACKLYGEDHQVEFVEEFTEGARTGAYYFLVDHELLPDEVREWLGLSRDNGMFYPLGRGHAADDLVAHNDGGDTLEEIADIIESEPEGLFQEEVKT
jgi:hypothetical protein